MSNAKSDTVTRPVNPRKRKPVSAAKRAAAVEAAARADKHFACAYNVFHVARCRMWEALADLLDRKLMWAVVFATECAGSASARSENTAYFGKFCWQPEREPSGKKAGVRNLADYPEELRVRTGGWRECLSDRAARLADRAHGYLEHVSLVSLRDEPGSLGQPLLSTLTGAPVFAALWTGEAPPIEILRLPPLGAGNNADLTGRIYARMDRWRAAVADIDPRRIPLRGGDTLDIPGDGAISSAGKGARYLPSDSDLPGPGYTVVDLHPLRCYLAARTVFWAQVSRLETMFLGRLIGVPGQRGPLGEATQPDKHTREYCEGGEQSVSREDFAQELTPYTYRAMESWHPARGCFSTYYEFKVKHALRNLRAQNTPREDSFAQEQDFMSGAADPYSQKGASWRRAFDHMDAPAGVGEALVRGLTVQPDGPDYVSLRELSEDGGAKPAQRRAAREALGVYLADQAPGTTTLQPRPGVVLRRRSEAVTT